MEENSKKPTYEELVAKCTEVMNQNRYLTIQLNKAQEFIMYKRIDYLFKVLENHDLFDSEFVSISADEIQKSLMPTEENEAEK